MTVPHRFVGVWRRVGLGVDGGPVRPAGDVVWVQADAQFADLRVGASETRAFAGIATWSAPSMTWSHDVDVPSPGRHPAPPDTGLLEGEADDLVERGSWRRGGRQESYVEHWRRIGSAGPVRALRYGTARFVQVGEHAVLVTPDGGRRWERVGGPRTGPGVWRIVATVGVVTTAEPPAADALWAPWNVG